MRRIQIIPLFEDYDKVHIGSVTRSQVRVCNPRTIHPQRGLVRASREKFDLKLHRVATERYLGQA